MIEPELNGEQIQGNVIPGFNTDAQILVGLRVQSADGAREWLHDYARRVTTLAAVRNGRPRTREDGKREPVPGGPWRNVCLSCDGLAAFGVEDVEQIEDRWFKAGMWNVAGSLGDESTDGWKLGSGSETTPHLLVILADNAQGPLDDAYDELCQDAARYGLEVTFQDRGTRREDKKEHFGFRDGIANPTVRGRLNGKPLAPRLPAGHPLAERVTPDGQPLLWTGQAVFGYPGQSRTDPEAPGGDVVPTPEWMRDGSFLVFRRLRQHVEVFREFLESAADRFHAETGRRISADHVGAMLVGRWPNGTPLVRYPDKEGPDGAADNHFRYMTPSEPRTLEGEELELPAAPSDLDGARCPHFAHIRKVNPRDAPTDLAGEAMTRRLQPFRRGIPFEADGERGMLFLAYGTTIRDGFGVLSRGWVNRLDAPEPGRHGPDPVIGAGPSPERRFRFSLDGPPVEVVAPRPWVEPTGGGFFFAPSVDTLKRIAQRR